MSVALACLLLSCALHTAFASSNYIFSVGSSNSQDPHACGPRSIGLIDGDTAEWVAGSCIDAEWLDYIETAFTIESGLVVLYVNPGFGQDTNFYIVDFKSKNVSRVLIGGDQGEMRCVALSGQLSCYGVTPGDDNDPTQLIEVDGRSGDSGPVLNLTKYEGYSIGGSVIDPVNMMYHFIAVGDPHALAPSPSSAHRSSAHVPRRRCHRHLHKICSFPSDISNPAASNQQVSLSASEMRAAAYHAEPSDQWLVTIDLKRMAIVAEAPLTRNFMGPLSISQAHVRDATIASCVAFCQSEHNLLPRVWPLSTLRDTTASSLSTTRLANCNRFSLPTLAASRSFAEHSPESPSRSTRTPARRASLLSDFLRTAQRSWP
jgi:hypothetical protein